MPRIVPLLLYVCKVLKEQISRSCLYSLQNDNYVVGWFIVTIIFIFFSYRFILSACNDGPLTNVRHIFFFFFALVITL